jgi:hypothetical protein
MEFCIGVKAESIEKAVAWVELALRIKSEGRESSDFGGDYYAFSCPGGEYVRLFSNRDIYDDEPVIDGCDAWLVAIFVEEATHDSPVVQNLLKDDKHFVLVTSR